MHTSSAGRVGCVLLSSATLVVTLATPAAARVSVDPDEPEQGAELEWPPADTDGEWLPLPDELVSEPLILEACGSTLTLTVDEHEGEYRAMHQTGGTIRVEYRYDEFTGDISRESDGAYVEPFDIGGPGYEIFSADGLSMTWSFEGPSFFVAFDEVEAAAYEEHGLPPLFVYESGNITERAVFSADPAAETVESAEILTDTALGVRDVCDLLDEAAGG